MITQVAAVPAITAGQSVGLIWLFVAQVQLLTSIAAMFVVAFMLAAGSFGDLYGRKRVFIIGGIGLITTLVLKAVSPSVGFLTFMRGFNTVRDLGGGDFGLKRAIDEGLLPGSRILPSGTHIGITGSYADYTESWQKPRRFGGGIDRFEQIESFRKVAGFSEMLDAVRFNMKRGASQVKLLMGGGVASTYDPLDVNEFTFEEVKAAVDVAANWGTYVAVYIYTSTGIKKAIKAGVKSIEHGHLLDEEVAKMMADKGLWLCIQPFSPDTPSAEQALGPEKFQKFLEMANGFPRVMDFVNKNNINLAFGTDLSFTPDQNRWQANTLMKFSDWMSNFEILRMATSVNAELYTLSGERHPYMRGPLGAIKEGAYANILLVDGDPLKDLSVLGDDGNKWR